MRICETLRLTDLSMTAILPAWALFRISRTASWISHTKDKLIATL